MAKWITGVSPPAMLVLPMPNNSPVWLAGPCYNLPQSEKAKCLAERLGELTRWHAQNCRQYHNWLVFRHGPEWQNIFSSGQNSTDDTSPYSSAPPLSVNVFKHHRLLSVPEDQVVVQLNSSGTTGQMPSQIFLDRHTAKSQALALNRIVESIIGDCRLPLLLLDYPGILQQRTAYSARLAAILGFQRFGRPIWFAFQDDSWSLNHSALGQFQAASAVKPGLLVGMTTIVWLHLLPQLEASGQTLDLKQARLLHGGGWKRVERQSVTRAEFNSVVQQTMGLVRIHNYYGMVEQVGSIFMECERGHLHAPSFADVVVRNPTTLRPQPINTEGILQVVSALPESYPGHSLLTGDLGTIHGYDNCGCGRMGVTFSVAGRVAQLEPRGCGELYYSS